MAQAKDVFRPTIDSDQIFALLDIMDSARRGEQLAGLNPVLKSYYEKLRVQAFKIGDGIARPAYVATGIRKEPAVNMSSLGITEEDKQTVGLGQYNNPAELSDDVWAQVERDERRMLEELAAAGNKNIILAERREEDRTYQEDSHPTDNDNVHKLFMALKTSDL